MKPIKFSTHETAILVNKVKQYFEAELNQEIGQFDAEFLIDFFSVNVGSYYYNRGLSDAQLVMRGKLDDIELEIESLEKPSDFVK
ncbi:MAG: DUF2164 domain-containing protein [Arenicella sp.]|jgi:uncharacterized protein (DUF2164 family)|nr:DUF2164 domain-containing protein [Arenicella sp.]